MLVLRLLNSELVLPNAIAQVASAVELLLVLIKVEDVVIRGAGVLIERHLTRIYLLLKLLNY